VRSRGRYCPARFSRVRPLWTTQTSRKHALTQASQSCGPRTGQTCLQHRLREHRAGRRSGGGEGAWVERTGAIDSFDNAPFHLTHLQFDPTLLHPHTASSRCAPIISPRVKTPTRLDSHTLGGDGSPLRPLTLHQHASGVPPTLSKDTSLVRER
jgi:hypothetical protein